MKNWDYLKETAFWQDYTVPFDPKAPDEIVGRIYFIGWEMKSLKKPSKLSAFCYPIVVKKDSSESEKRKSKLENLDLAFEKFKQDLDKKDIISFAPALEIPKDYLNILSFFNDNSF